MYASFDEDPGFTRSSDVNDTTADRRLMSNGNGYKTLQAGDLTQLRLSQHRPNATFCRKKVDHVRDHTSAVLRSNRRG